MSKQFLENKAHAFAIAQIAIIFQSAITILIVICLIFSLNKITPSVDTLQVLLVIDILFIIFHLGYRALYCGPKVILQSSQKKVLLVHIISSLGALIVTTIFIQKELMVSKYAVCMVLLIWVISLASGVVFFKNKYKV